jgi:hypothetical protein
MVIAESVVVWLVDCGRAQLVVMGLLGPASLFQGGVTLWW